MPEYKVRWEIDLDADDPEAAAREALFIQRDPASIATFFTVRDKTGAMTGVVVEDAGEND